MSRMDTIIRETIVGGPFGRLVGLRLETIEADRVKVRLPFRHEVTTVADLVHGGAIASLIDTAGTAAAWSGADPERIQRGTTVGFTINYLAGGRGKDLIATACVIQRGRTLCVCDVDVRTEDEMAVARALVTYKLG